MLIFACMLGEHLLLKAMEVALAEEPLVAAPCQVTEEGSCRARGSG